METMTLAQAALQMEESGTQVKVGHFDAFAVFISYFESHYKPLLEAIIGGVALDDKQRHLLNFFCDDMLSAFSEPEADEPADPAYTMPADDPTQDVYAAYSPDMRKAVAYINEQLEPEDKDIIAAQVSKNFKQHMNPAYGVDDGKITDLLGEYGMDHDLPEGWWEEECDLDDIVLLIDFEN
jgi:hypothetical protein